jgi:hypothetical protein
MACGSPVHRFGDDWIMDGRHKTIGDSHLTKWWSSTAMHQIHVGDTAILVATKSSKVMCVSEVIAEPVEDRSHPLDPDKWPWTVELRPLVPLDGRFAPVITSFGLKVPHKYVTIKDASVARKLLKAIHPAL